MPYTIVLRAQCWVALAERSGLGVGELSPIGITRKQVMQRRHASAATVEGGPPYAATDPDVAQRAHRPRSARKIEIGCELNIATNQSNYGQFRFVPHGG